MNTKLISSCLLSALLPFSAMAHPGHGSTGGFTIIHYFSEPVHAILWVAFICIGVLYYRKVKLQKNKK